MLKSEINKKEDICRANQTNGQLKKGNGAVVTVMPASTLLFWGAAIGTVQ